MGHDLVMIRFVKANIDHCPQLQERFQILTVPALKYFRDQCADPDFEGYCHCLLYYKEKQPTQLKKRKPDTPLWCVGLPLQNALAFGQNILEILLISQNLQITFSASCTFKRKISVIGFLSPMPANRISPPIRRRSQSAPRRCRSPDGRGQ